MKHRPGRIVPVLIEECDPYEFHIRLDRLQRIDFRQKGDQARSALLELWDTPAPWKSKTSPPPVPKSAAPPLPPSQSSVILQEFLNRSTGMKSILLPAGSFDMGSPKHDKDAISDEKPRRRVTIIRPFYLGVHQVTQGEYERVMGENPSWFSTAGGGKERVQGQDANRLLVESVSWFMTVRFCNALSAKEGLAPFYTFGASDAVTVSDWSGPGYRLPTEAEWEFACRAGSTTRYSFGNDAALLGKYAWFGKDYDSGNTHPVGQKPPNEWGLCDMQGNVWEWCWDWYDEEYYNKKISAIDIYGPNTGDVRVMRGGCWCNDATRLRSAFRGRIAPAGQRSNIGFRLARTYH